MLTWESVWPAEEEAAWIAMRPPLPSMGLLVWRLGVVRLCEDTFAVFLFPTMGTGEEYIGNEF